MSAAIDEWNNHRPTNKNGYPMSMAMFCRDRGISRHTFQQRTVSDGKKDASRKKGRESKAKRRAGMSDETKEASRKKGRESDAKRRAGMTDEQRQAAKQKRHKLYLDQRTKKWKIAAANRNVSKYPKQPFDPQKHAVNPDIFSSINAAKQFDQRTLNEDGSHQALVCVVCDEIIKGVEPFC